MTATFVFPCSELRAKLGPAATKPKNLPDIFSKDNKSPNSISETFLDFLTHKGKSLARALALLGSSGRASSSVSRSHEFKSHRVVVSVLVWLCFQRSYVTIPQWHKPISYTCFLKGTVFSQLAGLKLYAFKISSMYHGYRPRIICSRKRHSVKMEALQARHGHWKAE